MWKYDTLMILFWCTFCYFKCPIRLVGRRKIQKCIRPYRAPQSFEGLIVWNKSLDQGQCDSRQCFLWIAFKASHFGWFSYHFVVVCPVQDSDIALAKELVEQDKNEGKVLELPYVVESDTLEGRIEGKFRTIHIKVSFSLIDVLKKMYSWLLLS